MSSGASRSATSISGSASAAENAGAIVGAEGVRIFAEEIRHALRRIDGVQCLLQIVVEVPHDLADTRLDLVLRRIAAPRSDCGR